MENFRMSGKYVDASQVTEIRWEVVRHFLSYIQSPNFMFVYKLIK
jgi:hypothetical protein